MGLSYKKLWKTLIDHEMSKTDLRKKTGLSQSTIAKLTRGENVNIEVLERICRLLNCEIGDIVELKEK